MMALEGIRIIDFSGHAAGPVCAMLLGDLGADVIKIEPPGGESARKWGHTHFGPDKQFSGEYVALNRNKKGIVLDVKKPKGLEIAYRLIKGGDVVLENMKVGVMERLGLGYEACARINPRIVYCCLTAFGTTGPLAQRPGFDLLMQAYAGALSITGEPDRPAVRIGPTAIDFLTGAHGALGILAALRERDTSGLGQKVDTSLYESAIHMLTHMIADYTASGVVPKRWGSHFAYLAPYGIFQARDREFYIGCSTDEMWTRLCNEAGWADLFADPRFKTNADRARNQTELYAILIPRFRQRDAAEWMAVADKVAIPNSLIHDMSEVIVQEQALAREAVIPVPRFEDLRSAGMPIKLGRTPATLRQAAPYLGEHTDDVLAGLGLAEAEIAALRKEGVVA